MFKPSACLPLCIFNSFSLVFKFEMIELTITRMFSCISVVISKLYSLNGSKSL